VQSFISALISFCFFELDLLGKLLVVLIRSLVKVLFLGRLSFCGEFVNGLIFEVVLDEELLLFESLDVLRLDFLLELDRGERFCFCVEDVVGFDSCHWSAFL